MNESKQIIDEYDSEEYYCRACTEFDKVFERVLLLLIVLGFALIFTASFATC